MKLTTYRVLIDGELSERLPLADDDATEGTGSQEMCGWGYEGDFIEGAEDNGRYGEIWEFVTFNETAMEQALDSDPAVLCYKSRVGLLVN